MSSILLVIAFTLTFIFCACVIYYNETYIIPKEKSEVSAMNCHEMKVYIADPINAGTNEIFDVKHKYAQECI